MPSSQRLYAQPPQNRGDPPAIRVAGGMKRDVGAVDTRCHDLIDGVIPALAGVFVLTFRPDVSDLILYPLRGAPSLALPAVMAHITAARRGPHRAGDELQQLGFPGAVGAGQHPSLSGTDGPGHMVEYSPLASNEVHAFQAYLD